MSRIREISPRCLGILPTKLGVQLLTVEGGRRDAERPALATVLSWIEREAIPFITLPGAGEKFAYRIPLHQVVDSLSGTYDLAADVEELLAATD